LFDSAAQAQELCFALVRLGARAAFQISIAELETAQATSVAPSIIENSITPRSCSKPLTLPVCSVI